MKKVLLTLITLIFFISNVIADLTLEGFKISDLDDSTIDYFGYSGTGVNKNDWYIMRSIDTGTQTNYTYTKGNTAYNTNWTNRANLTYYKYNELYNQ